MERCGSFLTTYYLDMVIFSILSVHFLATINRDADTALQVFNCSTSVNSASDLTIS